MAISADQGFALSLAMAMVFRGWALAELGQAEEGVAQIRQGLAGVQATGAGISWSYFLALCAEAHGCAGRPEEGLVTLGEAMEDVQRKEERWWEAEIHRLRGEMLLQSGMRGPGSPEQNHPEAEECFRRALDIARGQGARSLELRAATSLARLYQGQDRFEESKPILAEVFDWFTEGSDTADLREAKRVLEARSST
jgi:adenylate cyclase